MSLMNDALRKKSRETAVSPVAKGFIEISGQPRITRRWLVVLAGLILLTVAVFYGNHVMQSRTGNSLRVISSLPGHSRPPMAHPTDATSDAQHLSAVEPSPASAEGQKESLTIGAPTEGNHLATADVDPASPPFSGDLKRPDARAG